MLATGFSLRDLRRLSLPARLLVLTGVLLTALLVLRGSIGAVIAACVLLVVLPGFGLLRALRLHEGQHPLVVLCLGLAAGLGLSVSLSWAARFGGLPLPAVALVLALAGVLLLAVSSPDSSPVFGSSSRLERWAAFALLATSVLTVLVVSLALSAVRTNAWEDQTLLVQIVEWYSSGLPRANVASRVIGGAAHPYIGSDGLGYLLGMIAWASGFPADQLVWHMLSPLTVWIAPLAAYASAFQLCRRHLAGGLAAAFVALYGLITVDGVVLQSNFAFGYNALFVANTLRMFSLVILAPLALLTLITALEQARWNWSALYVPLLLAIVTTHPRTTLTLGLLLAAYACVWALAAPRVHWKRAVLLAGVSLAMCAGPTVQYGILGSSAAQDHAAARTEESRPDAVISDSVDQALQPMSSGGITRSIHLPLLGETQIATPGVVFMHPIVLMLLLAGLGGLPWVRRSRAAALGFASALVLMLIAFVPPLPDLLQRVMGPYYYARLVLGFVLLLPIAPLAILADSGLRWLARRRGECVFAVVSLALMALVALLLLDPLKIPYSPRTQLDAVTGTLALRDIQPFDTALLDRLRQNIAATGVPHSVWLAPNRIASFIIESVPGAWITGGRRDENDSLAGALRYYDPATPWLDSHDLAFLSRWGVTHVLMEADDSRLPQMLLQAQRFRLVEQVEGYAVFEVSAEALAPRPADWLFVDMNRALLESGQPRYDRGEFLLARGGEDTRWGPLVRRWQDVLARDPEDANAQFGLAFALLLAGQDEAALPLWQALSAREPALWLPRLAAAATLRNARDFDAARALLAEGLRQPVAAVQVQAADHLLTESFSFLMDDPLLDEVLAVRAAQPELWKHLAVVDREERLRQRVSVLLSRAHFHEASDELGAIPVVRQTPQDVAFQAVLALARADRPEAERLLQEVALPRDVYARVFQRPDRWAASPVPALLSRLRTESAAAELPADSPLWIAQTGQLFVVRSSAVLDATQQIVHVTALIGSPYADGLPVRELRAAAVNARTYETYGEVVIPLDPDVLLTPVTLDIPLAGDPSAEDDVLIVLQPRNSPAVFYPSAYITLSPSA